MNILLNGCPLLIVDVSVTFSGKHQRRDQTFSALVDWRLSHAKVRFILVRFADPLLIFIPQHRTSGRATPNNQRFAAISGQQFA